MKNNHIEQILQNIHNGKEVSALEHELVQAYRSPQYVMYNRICWDDPIRSDAEARSLTQNLLSAGFNELYVTGDWSNQLSRWLAMDECGLRLRGIVSIENAAFEQEVKKWGSSDFDPTIPALKFSFE